MHIPHSREIAVDFFEKYVTQESSHLKGLNVYDLSTGSGYIVNLFHKQNAKVHLYDLIPDNNQFCEVTCYYLNMQHVFPIENDVADLVICSETIEHLPNQYLFFQEISRILKPSGKFILTTPNTSSLRSRFAYFVGESEHYNSPLPTEHNAFTLFGDSTNNNGYFAKIFISGILRLRLLAAINKLQINKIVKTQSSSTSRLLLIFYPIIYYFNRKTYKRHMQDMPEFKNTFREIFNISISKDVLLSKHLIVIFGKHS